jgi:hypothetical protein
MKIKSGGHKRLRRAVHGRDHLSRWLLPPCRYHLERLCRGYSLIGCRTKGDFVTLADSVVPR